MAQSILEKTRKISECPVFGKRSDFREAELPIYESVIKCFCFIKHNIKGASEKDFTLNETCDTLVLKIEQMWSRNSIPVFQAKQFYK